MPEFPLQPESKEEKKRGFGDLFGHRPEIAGPSIELSGQLNNISARMRLLEERYNNLRNKTQVTEQNILDTNKGVENELKLINSDLTDFKREFEDLKGKVKLIVKELRECAKIEEVKVLENYINLWEPMHFITREEVEKVIDEKLNQRRR